LILHLAPFTSSSFSFSFTAPSPTALYTLSLHDALPIYRRLRRVSARPLPREHTRRRAATHRARRGRVFAAEAQPGRQDTLRGVQDRKSTRLNSSHVAISYAVFCLKKKKKKTNNIYCILT